MVNFEERRQQLDESQKILIALENKKVALGNGIFDRYENPVLTAAHTPLNWKYDFNPQTNPFLLERIGINATFNAGAIKFNGKYMLIVIGLILKSTWWNKLED